MHGRPYASLNRVFRCHFVALLALAEIEPASLPEVEQRLPPLRRISPEELLGQLREKGMAETDGRVWWTTLPS